MSTLFPSEVPLGQRTKTPKCLSMKSDANIMHLGNNTTSLFFQQNFEQVIYILNSYLLYRTDVSTMLYLKVKYVQVWYLLIKHSLNTILLSYLYETQMFIKVLNSELIYKPV